MNGSELWLIDIFNRETIQLNINTSQTYIFNRRSDHYPSRFKLISGNPEQVAQLMSDILSEIPVAFSLNHNYPNPFNPITTIEYSLKEPAHVTMMIYDMLGRKVTTLKNEEQDLGFYQVQWKGTNDYGRKVSSGVYFYAIQMGDFKQVKKMVLLK